MLIFELVQVRFRVVKGIRALQSLFVSLVLCLSESTVLSQRINMRESRYNNVNALAIARDLGTTIQNLQHRASRCVIVGIPCWKFQRVASNSKGKLQ